MIIVAVLIGIIIAEASLVMIVRRYRRDFQWLITEADEAPELDPTGLDKFINSSYDPDLGWVRRPDTTGIEKGKQGNITFRIDSEGSRNNTSGEGEPVVASFGDSYVFCRQVEDGQTWQSELSRKTGKHVMNFGVGNYGADQGLLRYESTTLPESVQTVILGFVPETICRVHSYWKHYLEFGNTFAFKPRFILEPDGELTLLKNPVRTPNDFNRLKDILPWVQERDGFYRSKFRRAQFRRPYLWSFLKQPMRHTAILSALIIRSIARLFTGSSGYFENLPFRQVMKYNIREAQKMYSSPEKTALLTGILRRFGNEAGQRGHRPLVLVLPQRLDLELGHDREPSYQSFFKSLNGSVPVLDMTDIFREKRLEDLYIEDHYGGHLSVYGNRLVAEHIQDWLMEPVSMDTGS